MRNVRKVGLFLIFVCLPLIGTRAGDVRIGWDFRSYHNLKTYNVNNQPGVVGDNSHYPRTKRLSNGDLLMVFMDGQLGSTIYSRRSTDNGQTWSNPNCVRQPYPENGDNVCFACPDFLELPDGTILLVYQWRYSSGFNDYPNTNKNAGIELIKSTNHGAVFSTSTARRIYSGRNWEPSLLQLPSGEIQMFFTDSHVLIQKSEGIRPIPGVGMVRSFDNGETWTPAANPENPETVHISRSLESVENYKDGMPVAQYLDDNKGIAVAIECDGGQKTPWIVWSSAATNWNYSDFTGAQALGPGSDRRWLVHNDFRGFAPYMAKLPTGEILVQSNGKYKNEEAVWLFIGDKEAKNFNHASKVFRNVGAWWGSVAYIGDNQVISSANVGYSTDGSNKREILVTKGYVNRKLLLSEGDLPATNLQQLDKTDGLSWFIGNLTQQQCFLKMSRANDYLHIRAYVYDRKVNAYSASKDAIQLLLYRARRSFRITVDVQNNFKLETQSGPSSYSEIASSVVPSVTIDGTLNNNSDTDTGFIIDVKIPWTLIGGATTASEICQMHPKMFVNDSGSADPGNVVDEMCGQLESELPSWLSFELPTASEIRSATTFALKWKIVGNLLHIDVPSGARHLELYDAMGRIALSEKYADILSFDINISNLDKGVYLLKLLDSQGKIRVEKVLITSY